MNKFHRTLFEKVQKPKIGRNNDFKEYQILHTRVNIPGASILSV